MTTRHRILLRRFSALLIGGALLGPLLPAQFGTEALPDRDIGRPPRAPLITFLGIVNPGKLATDPSLPPKGPVAAVLYEELRGRQTPAGAAGDVVTSIRTTYNADGLPIEEARTESRTEFITISRYQGSRLVSQESVIPTSKTPLVKFWNYWTYDQAGKLTEYRRGRGDELQNHVLNFKRDAQGRLIAFEYREGAKDAPNQRTEVRYSDQGRTAEFIYYDSPTGETIRSMIQTLDDRGQVVQLEIRERDWKTKLAKPPLKVAFRYDEKGRLVEQNTSDHEFDPSGSEQELPPGKISLAYDDVKHTRTTEYSAKDGRMASTATFDATGAVIGFSVATGTETIDASLDCTYDSYGNWTACRQVAQAAGVSAPEKSWRRTITYR